MRKCSVYIKDLQIWLNVFNINDVDLFAMEVIFLHVKLFIKANLSPPDFDFILYLHVDYRVQLTDILLFLNLLLVCVT